MRIFRGMTLVELLVIAAIVLMLGVPIGIVPTGYFVPKDKAIRALETQGFSEVKIIDRAVFFIAWRGGDGGDSVRFTAEAMNPAGKRVTINVFSGWLFKDATIRTP